MKIDMRQEGNVTVLTPDGQLIIGRGDRLMNETVARLFADHHFNIIIDMSGISRIDSSGVDALVTAVRRARENGGDAKLARLTPRVQTLLEITQLTSVFDIYADVPAALSNWTNSPAGS
jgi:anti-sigma B factor antagonist